MLKVKLTFFLFFIFNSESGFSQQDFHSDIDCKVHLLQTKSVCNNELYDKIIICDDNKKNKIIACFQDKNGKLKSVSYNFNYNDSLFEKRSFKYSYSNNILTEEITYYNPYTVDGFESFGPFNSIEYQYENNQLKKIKFSNNDLIREMIITYDACMIKDIEILINGIKLKCLNFEYELSLISLPPPGGVTD